MATQIVRQRIETPERWTRALERAIGDGAESCTCPAGLQGLACKHRACYLAQIGELPLPDVKSMDLTPGSVVCPACRGAGQCYVETHGGAGWPDQVPCRRCDGIGWLTAVIRTLDRPTALAVAAD